MNPVLFSFPAPDWLSGIFPSGITIYSYGFFIVIGALLGMWYTTRETKRQIGASFDTINTLFILLILAAVIGGKVFFFFENPSYYLQNPKKLLSGQGFVFYGSLLFTIPVMLWYFKKHKFPVMRMLDIMAITTGIVHFFGRIGCFMAGCCYGKPHAGILGVHFTHPDTMARPLGEALHPTQLYDAGAIFMILLIIVWIRKWKTFDGQIFLSYLMLYAISRSVVEIFRGDLSRGFIIGDWLSHSQFISFLLLIVCLYFYRKMDARAKALSKIKRK
jgi:phosphatidylglycerol---prolipoprotein diacylglyceryl transferase